MLPEAKLEEKPQLNPSENTGGNSLVGRFLVMWFTSVAALAGVALASNIEWARPHIQSALASTLRREVTLGRMGWSFGLNGLQVETTSLEVKDQGGGNFIKSKDADIGVAFLPLLEQKVIISHLSFHEPEVWAKKLSDSHWNFSDLLTDGPEVRFLQIDKGRLHLTNLAYDQNQYGPQRLENNWSKIDLDEIKLKLIFPKKSGAWPFYLAFKYPQKNYSTSLKISATGHGTFEDWKKNKYSLDAEGSDVSLSDLAPFLPQIGGTRGMIDFKLNGEGIFNKGILATVDGDITKLSLDARNGQSVDIPHSKISANLLLKDDELRWTNLSLGLPSITLNSAGQVLNWRTKNSSYEARVGGQFKDIKAAFNDIVSKLVPGNQSTRVLSLGPKPEAGQPVAKAKLLGSATVEVKLSGDNNRHNMLANIKVDGVPLSQLLANNELAGLITAFKLEPSSQLNGELQVDDKGKMEFRNLELPVDGSKLVLNGSYDGPGKDSHIAFKGNNLSVDTVKRFSLSDPTINKLLGGKSSGSGAELALKGKLDLDGKYSLNKGKRSLNLQADLHQLSLGKEGKVPFASEIYGRINLDNNKLSVSGLKGKLNPGSKTGGGEILLNGSIGLDGRKILDISVVGKKVDVASINQVLRLIEGTNTNSSTAEIKRVTGLALEIRSTVKGPSSAPTIAVTVVPEDIYIKLPSGDAQLHIDSGSLSYDSNEVNLNEIIANTKSGRLKLSGKFQVVKNQPQLRWLSARSDGIEITELRSYLEEPMLKQNLSPKQKEFLTEINSVGTHGRLYGDLKLSIKNNEPVLEGVLGFNNAGGKFFDSALVLDNLTGVVAVTENELLFQDVQGKFGKSNFMLDASVIDFRRENLNYNMQLRSRMIPSEIIKLYQLIGMQWKFDSVSQDPVFVRLTAHGDRKEHHLSIKGRADAKNQLKIRTDFGTISQPRGQIMTLDSSLTVSDLGNGNGIVQIHSGYLRFNEKSFQGGGKYKWYGNKNRKPYIELAITTPQAVPIETVLAAFDSSGELKNSKGEVKMTFAMAGPKDELMTHGSAIMENLSIPELNISNLTGRLETPKWAVAKRLGKSEAKLNLKTITIAGVPVENAQARIEVTGGVTPRIELSDGSASFSGGQVNMEGWYEPDTSRFQTEIRAKNIHVANLVQDVTEKSSKVSGIAEIQLKLHSQGAKADLITRNLGGSGHFNVVSASVESFGKLQEKLNGANLLAQGIFGFNVNNLLQTVIPVKTGQFKDISGKLEIDSGIVHLYEVFMQGNDLRMRADGHINLPMKTADFEVAGDIPRVTSSVIPGPFGEISRNFTLQRLVGLITFRKLRHLPSLPIIGDIASDDPRAFAFKVVAPLDQPKLLSDSVEKTFRWLPNKPYASAHPVPGL